MFDNETEKELKEAREFYKTLPKGRHAAPVRARVKRWIRMLEGDPIAAMEIQQQVLSRNIP